MLKIVISLNNSTIVIKIQNIENITLYYEFIKGCLV